MSYLGKIFFLINEKKLILFSLILLFFFSSIFEVLGIGLIGSFLAYLSNFEISAETNLGKIFYYLNNSGFSISSANSLALFIIIILIIRFFFQLIANYLILKFTNNTSKNLRKKLIETYLSLNYLDFINKDTASSYNELTTLTDQFINLLYVSLKLVSDLILISFIVTMLFFINSQVFLFLFLIFLFLILVNKFIFSKKISKLGLSANSLSEQIFKNFKEGLISFKQIKVLKKTKYFTESISLSLGKLARLLTKYNFFLVLIRYSIEFLIASILIFSSILIYSLNDNEYALVVLTVFGISAIRSLPIITNLVNSTNVLFYSKNAIDRIYNALKLKKKIVIKKEKDLVTSFNFESLEIKNLSFSYNNIKILEDINFQINLRDFIFLTGPSGSGKTTFLDILCGLIPADSDSIIINNDNSENMLNTFRNKIYYLSQNNFVLDDTLERNIAFANKEIDKNKLDLAIKLSGLENFNLKLKDQFNRNLGENASKISGGELQRIALARAIYADKDILILDEFTSSLDKKNEKKIFETILKLNKTKTILVVSHNMEISKIAKKSFKIENKKIIKIS